MDKKLIVSPSPHIHGAFSTQRLMGDVLIALIPAFIVSVIVYGVSALWVTALSVVACVGFEFLIQRYLLKGEPTLKNLSAVVTGVLLAFNLPSTLPWWMVILGALVAIGVGKMSFGGLGCNPFNPALVGRVFLLISFPVQMTGFVTPTHVDPLSDAVIPAEISAEVATDAVTGPTLLGFVKEALAGGATTVDVADKISYNDMLLGFKSGSFGEIGALALLLGFLYLLSRRVITWHTPVSVLGSMFVFSGILWLVQPLHFMNPFFQILTGGALLGAIFMATDYVTSPMTTRGMVLYGVGIGVITILIRTWGAYPEGMSFAILIMNAVVPLINKGFRPKRFGVIPAKKE
ncbi:MAG: RnfABCDGE type electron transport complex subunit D [Alistipes sp.]|nr:RnfABCDGE type electron transport complex subunit D [Alistipes sp.]